MVTLVPQDNNNNSEHFDNRLERMEAKIDRLVEITATLSRIEETTSNQRHQISRIVKRLDEQEDEIRDLVQEDAKATGAKSALRWLAGALVSVIGVAIGWLSGTPTG